MLAVWATFSVESILDMDVSDTTSLKILRDRGMDGLLGTERSNANFFN